jgi:cytochrome c-type biogenesis protein CcmH/NrfG
MGGTLMPQATFMITKRITAAKTMRNADTAARFRYGIFGTVATFAALFVSFLAVLPGLAQESALDKGPAPPYMEPEAPPTPVEPTYDPLRANKSVEIGTFYMKRGNYDAAIERFRDATHFQPKLARSYSLLGEAYERKGDVDNALAAYRKYLDVYRTAPDRDKILKRIEKLESESAHAPSKQKSG